MNRNLRFVSLAVLFAAVLHCGKKPTNIEKPFVEQAIAEFTEERLAYYLHGGAPKPNSEILEKVLSRHSVKLFEFKPVLRRFYPEIHTRLLGG